MRSFDLSYWHLNFQKNDLLLEKLSILIHLFDFKLSALHDSTIFMINFSILINTQ